MKLLVSALRSEKGDIAANCATHHDLLGLARAERADMLVLPEMSLTGSVDPVLQPEGLVSVDGGEVAQLLEATYSAPTTTLVFGIAERDGGAAFITQCVARDGALLGTVRKRHLGDDEAGFAVGTETSVFTQGDVPFGVIICAESRVDFPFDDAVDAGAQLVCFCAAPGLSGRRTTDAARAAGHAWWESSGLADARRLARRRGVWVALATQAGATVDEDFPGLAAVVDPSGEVVARTPDWHEATLVVDLPLSGSVRASRAD
jgi:predicted amidohydrolase